MGDQLEDPLAAAVPAPNPIPPAPVAPSPAIVDKPNKYDAILDAQGIGQAQQIKANVVMQKSTPERAAQVRGYAQQLGLPDDLVDRNFDDISKRVKLQALPVDAMVKDTPHTAAFLADPSTAPVAADDHGALGALEWLVTTPSRVLAQSINEERFGALSAQRLLGPLTQAEHDQLETYRYYAGEGARLNVGNSWFRAFLTKSMQTAATLTVPQVGTTLIGGAVGATIGAAAGLPEFPVGVVAGAIAGGKFGAGVGYTAGLAKSAFLTGAGNAYDSYLNLRDELGQPMDPDAARAAALLEGGINAGLMTVGGHVIGSAIEKGAGKLFARDAIAAALRQPSIRQALGDAVRGYGTTLTEGAGLVVAQRAADILGEELLKATGREGKVAGQIARGNVDLFQQPKVKNADGSVSTVDSISIGVDGRGEVLIPRVTPDGRHLATDEAIAEYEKTGRNLGTFDSPAAADAFAQQLHEDYAAGKYDRASKYLTPGEITAALGRAALEGVEGFALVGAVGPAIGLAGDIARARRAEATPGFMEALADGVKQSKTAQRSPDAVEAFIDNATKGGPVENVYVPVEFWRQYWQDQGVDPRGIAEAVTGRADAYDQAVNEGSKLEIPTSRYATKLAATEHNARLADELALGPDEMSAREARDFVEQVRNAPAPSIPEESPIRSEILSRFENAGVPTSTATKYADTFAAAVTTLEARAGLGPIAGDYLPTVSRPDLELPAASQGPGVPASGPAAAEGEPGTLPASFGPGAYAGPERRAEGGQGPGGVERRARPEDQPIGLMPGFTRSDVAAAAAAMRAENPNIDKLADALRQRAASFDKSLPAGQTEEPHAEPPSPSGQPNQPGGAASDGVSASAPREREVRTGAAGGGKGKTRLIRETPEERATRRVTHYSDVFAHYLESARRLDPEVDPEAIRREFQFRLNALEEREAAYRDSGADPRELLRAIAKYGGIAETSQGYGGELARLREGTKFGALNGVNGVLRLEQKLDERGAPKTGLGVDVMLQRLQQDGRFPWVENESMLLDAIDEAARYQAPEDIFPGTDELRKAVGMDPRAAWWQDSWQPVDNLLEDSDALEHQGPVDTSFNVDEFNQSLFDDLDVTPPDEKVDVLTTGEQQPRLPGAGDVREQEIKTPEFEAPFSLTPPEEKASKPKKTEPAMSPEYAAAIEEQRVAGAAFREATRRYRAREIGDDEYLAARKAEAAASAKFEAAYDRESKRSSRRTLFQSAAKDSRVEELEAASTDEAMGVEFPEGEPSHFPDGSDAVVCTNCAEQIIAKFGGQIFGWAEGDNPTSVVAGPTHGAHVDDGQGHDFAVVDDRYLVDPWAKNVEGSSPRAAFDLENPADRAEVLRLYGDPKTWSRRERAAGSDSYKWVNDQPGPLKKPFQPAVFDDAALKAFSTSVKLTMGSDLQGFSLKLTPTGDIFLESLIVARGAQRAGLGSEAMRELTRFADANGRRITLTPAQPGDIGPGEPTSTGRLVKFYKRFGFVENKGDNRILELPEGMYREPSTIGKSDRLIVQHNLTEKNLLHAVKVGGLPVPSLAITRAGDSLTNFGEITLIGPKEMADPRGYARTRVFGADAYSPRYPTIHFKIDAKGEKALKAIFREHEDVGGQQYIDLDSLQKEGPKYLEQSPAIMAAYLKSKGIDAPPAVMDSRNMPAGAPRFSDSWATRLQLEKLIEGEGDAGVRSERLEEFKKFARKTFEQLEPTEHIYKGFTNAGNRSYQPNTLENVVKILKKNLRGGESESNIYGVGQLRAKFTPEFKSLKAIQDARGRIVSDADFDAVKKDVEAKLFDIADSLKGSYQHGDGNNFGFTDTVMAVMEEGARKGLPRALKEFGFEDVSEATQQKIAGFMRALRTLPTEYFEGKILRDVDLGEFKAAVAPDTIGDQARQALEARGVRVETYAKSDGPEARKRAVERVANELKDDVLFQQKRGAIRFGPGKQIDIALLERADLSTVLHEFGHLFVHMQGDIVDRLGQIPPEQLTDTQRQLMGDFGTLLSHVGADSLQAMSTEQHEALAREFEAYLMEGKAPAVGLQSTFSAFRAWLIGVYRSLKALNVHLTDPVRKVFDRMLATDQAIGEAEARRGQSQMFLTPEEAGMDPKEFEAYRALVQQAHDTAIEQLDRKQLAEVHREQTDDWKTKRQALEQDVEAETYQRPEYRALAAITKGQNPDGTPLTEGLETPPMQLSRKLIADRYGAERVKRLPRGVIAPGEGLDPNVVAEVFGYSSGDAMLTAIENAPGAKDVIRVETNKRMLEQHGSLLLDGTLPLEAQAAIANDSREQVIRAEMRALAKKRRDVAPFLVAERAKNRTALQEERAEREYERRWFDAEHKLHLAVARGEAQTKIDALQKEVSELKAKARGGAVAIRAGIPPDGVLRDAARQRLASTPIGAIKPASFWSAAREASRQATEKAARQDFDGAITAKQQELINTHLYREAVTALDDVEDRIRFAQQTGSQASRARLFKAGSSYRDMVDSILERFEFARVPAGTEKRRTAIADWAAGLEAQGLPVDLPPELLNEALRTNYKYLTLEEFRGVTDGLKEIVHLAQIKNRLLKIAAAKALEELTSNIADSVRTNTTRQAPTLERDRRASGERSRLIDGFFGSHRKLSFIAREMDGNKDGGPVWDALVRPLNEAGAREAEMNAAATRALGEIVETAYPRGEKRTLYDKVEVPAVGDSLSKMERLMIALNWGNEGNRDRIRRSEGWKDEQVQAVLDTLDARDLTFVQGVLDHINSYWQEIAAKQERVYGFAPEKVEATPIKAAAGEIAGGYFPLKYDDRLSARAAANLDLEAGNLAKQAAYANATTQRGHTKARVEGVKLPVRRDFGVIFSHVDQVIHDLSHHETLIDIGRVLASSAVQKAIYETYGDQVYHEIKSNIRDVAFGDVPARGQFEQGLNHLRAGMSVAQLGWSLTTGLLHLTSAAPKAIVRIGPKAFGAGMMKFARDAVSMESTAAWVDEKSAMMRTRALTQQREINEIRNKVGVDTGKFAGFAADMVDKLTMGLGEKQKLVDSYFYLLQQLQRAVDVPTWAGQYQKALEGEATEQDAIAQADQAVLDAGGGGQNKDLARIQRGGPLAKLFTNFYSTFNTTYNLATNATRATDFKSPKAIGRLAVDYLMLYTVPATLGYMIHHAAQGAGLEDDAKTIAAKLIEANLSFYAGTMVGIRELAGFIEGYADYQGPAGLGVFPAIGKTIQQGEQAVKAAAAGRPLDGLDEAFFKSLNETGGILFHYPAAQINRTLSGFAALVEGKTKNPGVLVVGAPKQTQQ